MLPHQSHSLSCVSLPMQVSEIRQKQAEHVSKLERKQQEITAENQNLKVAVAQRGHAVEEALAKYSQEASNCKQAQKELAVMSQQRDTATVALHAQQDELQRLKQGRSELQQQLTEATIALREAKQLESQHRQVSCVAALICYNSIVLYLIHPRLLTSISLVRAPFVSRARVWSPYKYMHPVRNLVTQPLIMFNFRSTMLLSSS